MQFDQRGTQILELKTKKLSFDQLPLDLQPLDINDFVNPKRNNFAVTIITIFILRIGMAKEVGV